MCWGKKKSEKLQHLAAFRVLINQGIPQMRMHKGESCHQFSSTPVLFPTLQGEKTLKRFWKIIVLTDENLQTLELPQTKGLIRRQGKSVQKLLPLSWESHNSLRSASETLSTSRLLVSAPICQQTASPRLINIARGPSEIRLVNSYYLSHHSCNLLLRDPADLEPSRRARAVDSPSLHSG